MGYTSVTAAYHMNARVLDLALVTDMGAGMGAVIPLSHEEVQKVAEQMKEPFGRLVVAIVEKIAKIEEMRNEVE